MSRSLAVAGLSARLMAEAAAADGFEVLALDLFGDADTCAAATRWFGIGEPAQMRIDGARLLSALEVLARRGDVLGWVSGSGFEAQMKRTGMACEVKNGEPLPDLLHDFQEFFDVAVLHDL